MKAIIIDHPNSENVLDLRQLTEICFRVAEHLNELWGKYDELDENLYCFHKLHEMFCNATDLANSTAWRIKNIHSEFGDLPF